MARIIDLAPHDALPDGPAVVVMRRFEEDDPKTVMIELIAIDTDRSEGNARMTDAHGAPLSWEEATRQASARAHDAKIESIYRIDRTAGPVECQIAAHGGDHTASPDMVDNDYEDGEAGGDMRDRSHNEAPRRF
ncbi:hypothetical protein [Lichenicoccus sp.]|uniref:hypothetical protein n=1 Tax=Lichenicoccus sp. TaxID=2781899 RepID=UPI003D10036D